MQPNPPGNAPYGNVPAPAAPPKKSVPAWGFLAAAAALFFGVLTFLYAGIQGHRAGWEMLALPVLATLGAALVGFVGSMITIFANQRYGPGIFLLGMSGVASLLALVGFVLGA